MTILTPEEIFGDIEKIRLVDKGTDGGYFTGLSWLWFFKEGFKIKKKEIVGALHEIEDTLNITIDYNDNLENNDLKQFIPMMECVTSGDFTEFAEIHSINFNSQDIRETLKKLNDEFEGDSRFNMLIKYTEFFEHENDEYGYGLGDFKRDLENYINWELSLECEEPESRYFDGMTLDGYKMIAIEHNATYDTDTGDVNIEPIGNINKNQYVWECLDYQPIGF